MKYPIKKIKITVLAVLSRLNLVLLFLSFVKKSDRNKRIKKKVEESPNPIPVILSKMENMPNIAKDRKREIDIISR
jgi:flagellar basal body-associated protein FliL